MSTRTRNLQQVLDDKRNYSEQMRFRFKGKNYIYSPSLHLMTLSAYVQASVQNTDQQIILVDLDLGKQKLKLSILELQTLLDKCDRALSKMERARTKVNEVAE